MSSQLKLTTPGIAVVTGASSGIGRACAIALSTAGWQVVISGRRHNELVETAKLAKEQRSDAKEMTCVAGDLSKKEDVDALFATVEKEFGASPFRARLLARAHRVDNDRSPRSPLQCEGSFQIHVNPACARANTDLSRTQNAGRGAKAVPMDEISLEDFNSVLAINVTAPFLCTQHAFRIMRAQSPQGGRIINKCARGRVLTSTRYEGADLRRLVA